MKTGLSVLLIVLLLGAGCHNTTTTPTITTPTSYFDSQVFAGLLSPQGTAFQAVTVPTTATVTVMLASLTLAGTTTTVSVPLLLGLGSLSADATSCTSSVTATATPALTSQINQSLITGTYCVLIADPGNVTSDVNFAVRINQSANTVTPGRAGVETFSSNLYPLGVATRTFAASGSGNVTVTISSVSPAATLGIGIGIPINSDCVLNTSAVATPGSGTDVSATAEAGTYCVRMFDTGQLPGRVLFDVRIAHP